MENKFIEIMSKRTDSELLEIVTKFKNDYQPDAINAAEDELKKRNLSSEQLDEAKEEILEKEVKQHEKENDPLGIGQRILFFIFFWGVIPWAMAGTFKASGYSRKYKDAWRFMKYGFLTFIGFNVLLFLLIYFIII